MLSRQGASKLERYYLRILTWVRVSGRAAEFDGLARNRGRVDFLVTFTYVGKSYQMGWVHKLASTPVLAETLMQSCVFNDLFVPERSFLDRTMESSTRS